MKNFRPDAYTFKTITDASPYPVYLCMGEKMTVAYANDATLKTWGKTEEVIGKPFLEAIPELKEQPFMQLLLNVFHTGEPHYSLDKPAQLHVDGKLQTFYFKFSYQPFRSPEGEITGIFCFATDVTELVKSRQLLIASEESLRLAISAAELGTFDKDLKTGRFFWDQRTKELFNIDHDNLPTYDGDFLPGIHPDDRERIDLHMKEFTMVEQRSNGTFDVEYRTQSPLDGRIRWIRSKGKVYFNAEHTPQRFIGTVIDITEQREAEMSKSDFVSIASHELKTPLTTIKAQVQLLLRRGKQYPDDFSTNSLQRVNRQIDNMTTIINNFLNNNRLLEGKIQLQLSQFNLHELLTELVTDHVEILSQHTLVLQEYDEVIVNADRSKISQVIENMLTNAAKYAAAGTMISISCKTKTNEVEISISDQGVGIPLSEQHKIFERFYRVENPLVKNSSGFGLGLYLVSEILRYHKSEIKVDSEPGKGSRFYFSLPIVKT